MSVKNRYYDPEFKQEAVRLVLEEGRRIREVERTLGITQGLLNEWVRRYRLREGEALVGHGTASAAADAVKRMKLMEADLKRVRMERDILKKAMAVFSRDRNPYSGS